MENPTKNNPLQNAFLQKTASAALTPFSIELLAFLIGAAILVLEITGSRLLAPEFGSSIFVWTAQIFTVLVALSLGYLWGGRLADSKDGTVEVSRMLLGASLSLSLSLLFSGILLPLSALFGAKIGPFVFSASLFFLPCFFAGALTPLLLRIYVHSFGSVGNDAGKLYAISTIGSMAGALLSAYLIVPFIGAKAGILLACAFFALCAAYLIRKPTSLLVACFLVLVFSSYSLASLTTVLVPSSFSILSEYDSEYFHFRIVQNSTHRALLLDADWHSMSALNGTGIQFEYARQMAQAAELSISQKEKARIGIIGLGAGTLASYFSQKNHSVYAYEIDPQVHEAAKKYFSLPSADNLRVHIGDARESLSKYLAIKYPTKFDVLLVDAFASKYSIPAHLVTKEAFNVYSAAISKNGIIAINIISAQSSPKSLVFRSISSTMRATFPYQVALASPASLPNGVQNIVLIGSAQPFPAPFISSLEKNNPVLQSWGQGEIFTDERSFVDYAMMEVLQ